MRDEHDVSHGAVNWRGNLDDLTADELRERADQLAWVIANAAAAKRPARTANAINDPVTEFTAARDAWFVRLHSERGQ